MSRSRRAPRCPALLRLLLLALVCGGLAWDGRDALAAGEAAPVRWRRTQERSAGDGVTAVAAAPAGDAVAFGTTRGVWLLRPGEPARRVESTARVNDLAFDPPGRLWIATDDGLRVWDPGSGRVWRHTPGAGARSRRVARLAVRSDTLVAATDLGAYALLLSEVTDGPGRFRAVDARVPSGAATAVALDAAGETLWLAAGRRVWRVSLARRAGTLVVAAAEPEPMAAPRPGETPVDLVRGLPGAELVALFPDALAVRRAPDAAFELHRPSLPPGAAARRLGHAQGRYWLATDRGLLESARLEGPWRRAAPPAGSADTRALAAGAGTLWAATAAGLLAGDERGALVRGSVPDAPASRRDDPDVRAVQRAALAYLALDRGPIRRMRRGLAVRGLMPEVDLRFGTDLRRKAHADYDQSFVSGATHHLYDSDEDRERQHEYGVVLSWDLPRLAYDPERVDVSREAREVIELRDDVLDEVNQLYFERRRVLDELAALDAGTPEARRLRIRADELAAGLDAWTGGWFARAIDASTPDHGPASEDPRR